VSIRLALKGTTAKAVTHSRLIRRR
jgi:hypothetical protein